MYDSHLSRISNRPGEKLQILLARKLLIKFLNLTKNNLSGNSKPLELLEIGSGSGRMLPIVVNMGLKYTAVEPTKIMRCELEKVAERSNIQKQQYKVINNSLPNLRQVSSSKFDLTIALHVIEHAPNPYIAREWLEEMQRILTVGGYVFLVTPYFPDYRWRFYDVDWSHSFPTTVNNLREILTDLNFQIIEATTVRGWSSNKMYSGIVGLVLRLIPVAPLDFMAKVFFKEELLFSGFSSGYLRRNTFLVARKI